MKMNPIEPRYRTDSGQPLMYGEANIFTEIVSWKRMSKMSKELSGVLGGGAYLRETDELGRP